VFRSIKAAVLLVALASVPAAPAPAGTASEVRGLYDQFLAAQNARDLEAVRAVLLPSPEFQWVSDGKSFWGPDALVARMSQFQKAELWHVTPDTARARRRDRRRRGLSLPAAHPEDRARRGAVRNPVPGQRSLRAHAGRLAYRSAVHDHGKTLSRWTPPPPGPTFTAPGHPRPQPSQRPGMRHFAARSASIARRHRHHSDRAFHRPDGHGQSLGIPVPPATGDLP